MLKWLKEDADWKIWFKLSLSITGFDFKFIFYNIDFSIYIPFPHLSIYVYNSLYCFNVISPFSYKYKNCNDCRRRYLEFNSYFDSSLDTGFELTIPHEPRDHDDRVFSLNLLGFGISISTYHSWHVCHCKKNGIIRFPTPEECKKWLDYSDELAMKFFGSKKLPQWKEVSKNQELIKKLQKFYSLTETYYNNIPLKDKENN